MNIIASSFRTFKRFKLYSSINLGGIVLGLTCSIVIILYVGFQFSFDNFHADKERIFRVSEIATMPTKVERNGSVRIPVGIDLKERFDEIEDYVHVGIQNHVYYLKYEEQSVSINRVLYTSENFFEFFSFNLIVGNKSELLQNDQSVVITQSAANKLFEGINPIGKNVILNNKTYTVSGVSENPPINSHIQFDAVLSINPVINMFGAYIAWDGGLSVPTFVKLIKPDLQNTLVDKIPDLAWEKINKKEEGSGFFTEIILEPLSSIHAKSDVDWDSFDKKEYAGLLSLGLVGMLVLFVALLNYLFLSNGMLSLRYKEFGVKRYLGMGKKGMLLQLLSENIMVFTLAFGLTVTVIFLLEQSINHLLDATFIIPQLISNFPIISLGVLSIAIISTYLQYLYVQKQLLKGTSSTFVRSKSNNKTLWITSIQFAASIVLMVVIIGIYKQLNFMNNKELGFKTENIIYVSHDKIGENKEALISEFKKIPGVTALSTSFGLPGIETTSNGYLAQGSEQHLMFNALHVDDNFFETYGLQMTEGRTFKPGVDLDSDAFIVNETLVKQLGWENPIGKIINRGQDFKVVGVVKDFHVASMYETVPPLIISKQHAQQFYTLSIALNTNDYKQTLVQLEEKWNKIMPNLPFNYEFLDTQFATFYSEVQRTGKVMLLFASLSILISIAGLFALTMLYLNSRIKEIGVRKVNGASISEVLIWLNQGFIVWVIIAFIAAAPLSYVVMQKWLSQFAYKTTLSWWVFALAGCVALFIALLTVSWQTIRAARRNPVEALRYE